MQIFPRSQSITELPVNERLHQTRADAKQGMPSSPASKMAASRTLVENVIFEHDFTKGLCIVTRKERKGSKYDASYFSPGLLSKFTWNESIRAGGDGGYQQKQVDQHEYYLIFCCSPKLYESFFDSKAPDQKDVDKLGLVALFNNPKPLSKLKLISNNIVDNPYNKKWREILERKPCSGEADTKVVIIQLRETVKKRLFRDGIDINDLSPVKIKTTGHERTLFTDDMKILYAYGTYIHQNEEAILEVYKANKGIKKVNRLNCNCCVQLRTLVEGHKDIEAEDAESKIFDAVRGEKFQVGRGAFLLDYELDKFLGIYRGGLLITSVEDLIAKFKGKATEEPSK